MKLLVCTQTVDESDSLLGFFTEWIKALSREFDTVTVICLNRGSVGDMPENVRILSLGKESGAHRLEYVRRLYFYSWRMRKEYDAVFVHMNQEYILLAGILWRMHGKKVGMWRNHYAGSMRTALSVLISNYSFCTSRFSYTARFGKTMRMPVGVDTKRFYVDSHDGRKDGTILFLARMAPSKRAHVLLDALALLAKRGVDFHASFVGSPIPRDEEYHASLKKKAEDYGLAGRVSFEPGVAHREVPAIFRRHDIFVNASPSGMFDKTIFEAAACGCLVVSSSEDMRAIMKDEWWFALDNAEDLSRRLEHILGLGIDEKEQARKEFVAKAMEQSLTSLASALRNAYQPTGDEVR